MGNKITETKARSIQLRVLHLVPLGGLLLVVRVFIDMMDVMPRDDVPTVLPAARTGGITGR